MLDSGERLIGFDPFRSDHAIRAGLPSPVNMPEKIPQGVQLCQEPQVFYATQTI